MAKRNRLRSVRPKALLGEAVSAAATLAAAGLQVYATHQAAKQQVDATQKAAQMQADALAKQNEVATANQQRMIDFTRTENERRNQIMLNAQLNGQMQAGAQNALAREQAARLQFKKGGSKRKLRNASIDTSLLQGSDSNLPFRVTDGGGVVPLGNTPEGYDLYEIRGNDHKHYHKTRGKHKTGVGIKFADGQEIEGEGNQNSNQGELLLVTPDDAKFISKHSIDGFNPAQAVMDGMNPMDAFNQQEYIKAANGISDDGDYPSPVERMMALGGTIGVDSTSPFPLDYGAYLYGKNIIDENNMNIRKLRNGGRLKARIGIDIPKLNYISPMPSLKDAISQSHVSEPDYSSLPSYQRTLNPSDTGRGNYIGAGITAGGNMLGGLITHIGNNAAARRLNSGLNSAADTLVNAYGQLHGIDMSAINRNNYRAAHAIAALQAPVVSTGSERSAAERSLQRNLRSINQGSLSSAAALNRGARANTAYNDIIGQIEANANKSRQEIIQGNMGRITEIANANAQRDTEASKEYANAYLNLLQYNNDIENEKIVGAAQARADALAQTAGNTASAWQSNASNWSNALTQSASGFSNAITTNAKMNDLYNQTMAGATDEAAIRSVLGEVSSRNVYTARGLWERYRDGSDEQKRIAARIAELYHFNA